MFSPKSQHLLKAITGNTGNVTQCFDYRFTSFLLVGSYTNPCMKNDTGGFGAEQHGSAHLRLFLFYQETTSIKQQGKNLLVSHLYSWHERRCWHVRWLPVNNAHWASLDVGFTIAWSQLATIQECLVSSDSGELLGRMHSYTTCTENRNVSNIEK